MEQKDVARYVAVSILSILLTALLICQHNINVRQEKLEEYLYSQPIVSDTIEYEEGEPIEPIVTLETESMSSNVVNAIVEPEIEEPDVADVDLLAHVINGEAGAEWCDEEMRYYVGSVVLNRVAHEEFPNTLEDVIYHFFLGILNNTFFTAHVNHHTNFFFGNNLFVGIRVKA